MLQAVFYFTGSVFFLSCTALMGMVVFATKRVRNGMEDVLGDAKEIQALQAEVLSLIVEIEDERQKKVVLEHYRKTTSVVGLRAIRNRLHEILKTDQIKKTGS